jgi:uncharacterized protein (TIGR03435 family)
MPRLVPIFAVVSSITLAAQVPAPETLRFEVASVKRAASEPPLPGGPTSPDRFYRTNITLRNLINYAYDLRLFRILGGPEWTGSDRWDVSAKAERAPSLAEMRTMVQRLLAERFGLKAHLETRDLPTYDLVLARDDGRLGPNMKPAAVDCEPFRSGQRAMREAPLDDAKRFPRCGTSFSIGGGVRTARYNGTPMSRLAVFLQTDANRVVIDKTGVSGSFDIELTFEDEESLKYFPGAKQREAPSLFTALQEQLGLKLESSRGPVEVLVIDSVDRPTAD